MNLKPETIKVARAFFMIYESSDFDIISAQTLM